MNKDNTVKYVNIDWKPDKSLKVPLYSQIVRYFSRKIESGDWVSGQFIPPQFQAPATLVTEQTWPPQQTYS